MDLGSLELQIFVSLVVVLGAAFVALICDYLKGNNEQLREHNIELRVRKEEQERQVILDPAGFLARYQGAVQPLLAATQQRLANAIHAGRLEDHLPETPTEVLDEVEQRVASMRARSRDEEDFAPTQSVAEDVDSRRSRRRKNRGNRPKKSDGQRISEWVRPEVMAKVALRSAKAQEELVTPEVAIAQEALVVGTNNGNSATMEPGVVESGLIDAPPPASVVETVAPVVEITVPPSEIPTAEFEVSAEALQREIERVARAETPGIVAHPLPILRPLTVPSLRLEEELQRIAETAVAPVVPLPVLHSALLEEVILASVTKSNQDFSLKPKAEAEPSQALETEIESEVLESSKLQTAGSTADLSQIEGAPLGSEPGNSEFGERGPEPLAVRRDIEAETQTQESFPQAVEEPMPAYVGAESNWSADSSGGETLFVQSLEPAETEPQQYTAQDSIAEPAQPAALPEQIEQVAGEVFAEPTADVYSNDSVLQLEAENAPISGFESLTEELLKAESWEPASIEPLPLFTGQETVAEPESFEESIEHADAEEFATTLAEVYSFESSPDVEEGETEPIANLESFSEALLAAQAWEPVSVEPPPYFTVQDSTAEALESAPQSEQIDEGAGEEFAAPTADVYSYESVPKVEAEATPVANFESLSEDPYIAQTWETANIEPPALRTALEPVAAPEAVEENIEQVAEEEFAAPLAEAFSYESVPQIEAETGPSANFEYLTEDLLSAQTWEPVGIEPLPQFAGQDTVAEPALFEVDVEQAAEEEFAAPLAEAFNYESVPQIEAETAPVANFESLPEDLLTTQTWEPSAAGLLTYFTNQEPLAEAAAIEELASQSDEASNAETETPWAEIYGYQQTTPANSAREPLAAAESIAEDELISAPSWEPTKDALPPSFTSLDNVVAGANPWIQDVPAYIEPPVFAPEIELPFVVEETSAQLEPAAELATFAESVEPPPFWFEAATRQPVEEIPEPFDVESAAESLLLSPEPEPSELPDSSGVLPNVRLPRGMHTRDTWLTLLEKPNPMSGIVFVISLQLPEGAPLPEELLEVMPAVDTLMESFLREEDFGCRVSDSQWVFVYEQDASGFNQRRIAMISEKLWDFQLRHLGLSALRFKWGAVDVMDESMADAVNAARARMEQSRKTRKTAGFDILSGKKVVNA